MRFVMRFVTLTFLSLLVLTMGCDFVQNILTTPAPSETNRWLGEWEIVSLDGNTIVEAFTDGSTNEAASGYGSVWFNDDGTWEGSVEVTFADDNFYVRLFIGFMGTYALSDNYFTLSITGGEDIFSDEGGKWEIEKDTLTLRFDDGSIIVFGRIYEYADAEPGSQKTANEE